MAGARRGASLSDRAPCRHRRPPTTRRHPYYDNRNLGQPRERGETVCRRVTRDAAARAGGEARARPDVRPSPLRPPRARAHIEHWRIAVRITLPIMPSARRQQNKYITQHCCRLNTIHAPLATRQTISKYTHTRSHTGLKHTRNQHKSQLQPLECIFVKHTSYASGR